MSFMTELKKFAMRGNLVDMAVGFTVGAAFTTIAKSLVHDIIMPPVGLILGRSDFSDLFLVLARGDKNDPPYATLASAQSAGAVTINYGVFINNVIAFLVVTLVMFLLIRTINRIDDTLEEQFGADKQKPEDPVNKKCPFCRSVIAYRAVRCPACTSHITGIAGGETASSTSPL